MKKAGIFTITGIVLFIISIGSSFVLFNTAEFPLETVRGDASLLDQIAFEYYLVTENKYIKINTQGQQVSYKIAHAEGNSYDALIKQQRIDQSFYDEYIFADLHTVKGDKEWKKAEFDWLLEGNSYLYRNVEQAEYVYNFHAEGKMITLYTGLMDYSNEYYQLYDILSEQDLDYVEEDYSNISIRNTNDEEETPFEKQPVYPSYEQLLVAGDDGYYYMMPKTNEVITGTNYIYQIDLRAESIGYKALVELPKRNAIELYLVNQHLLAISAKDGIWYIDRYDLDGNLVGSMHCEDLQYEGRFYRDSFNYVASNEQYMIFENQNKLTVIDTDDMNIIYEQKEPEVNDRLYKDAIYRNDTLYCLYESYSEKGMEIGIDIYKQHELLYEGKTIIKKDNKDNLYGDDINMFYLHFIR